MSEQSKRVPSLKGTAKKSRSARLLGEEEVEVMAKPKAKRKKLRPKGAKK